MTDKNTLGVATIDALKMGLDALTSGEGHYNDLARAMRIKYVAKGLIERGEVEFVAECLKRLEADG